jgi:hypothetical protein
LKEENGTDQEISDEQYEHPRESTPIVQD